MSVGKKGGGEEVSVVGEWVHPVCYSPVGSRVHVKHSVTRFQNDNKREYPFRAGYCM